MSAALEGLPLFDAAASADLARIALDLMARCAQIGARTAAAKDALRQLAAAGHADVWEFDGALKGEITDAGRALLSKESL